ncbi:MAG TPA: GNAT family N-acetyltransferase [Polyangiales bacterium]
MTSSRIPGTADAIALVPITRADAPALHNLYQLYAHDFSEFVALPINPDGRFGIAPSDLWWSSDAHYPFFIHKAGALCGFALVQRGSRLSEDRDLMDVAEFFVLRGARRRNIGQQAACALLDAFHGRWEIRVRQANAPALAFWSRVVVARASKVERRACTLEGVDWLVFAFST